MLSDTSDSRLIDELVPQPDYCEQHHVDLLCSRRAAYEAARTLDFSQSRVTRILFMIRGGLHFTDLTIEGMTASGAFQILSDQPPEEFVIGHVSERLKPVSVNTQDDFREAPLCNGLKIAWNFRTEVLEKGITRLHTETRVRCHGKTATRLFRPYWLIVKPFSGLIRNEMLKAAATTNQISLVEPS